MQYFTPPPPTPLHIREVFVCFYPLLYRPVNPPKRFKWMASKPESETVMNTSELFIRSVGYAFRTHRRIYVKTGSKVRFTGKEWT